jgi:hypothetical protein
MYRQTGNRAIKEGRCMIAHVHEDAMNGGFLTPLAAHGHRRTPVYARAAPGKLFRRSLANGASERR